ncbi:MAG: type II secretion system F family protein [Nanoarchaeota archaeon]
MYKLMPESYKTRIKEMLVFSGSKKTAEGFVNYAFSLSLAISFVTAIFSNQYFFQVWIIVFFSVFFLFHGFLILAVDKRTKFVEKMLPDALQLMSANIKAGYIPSRAILLSARKEFGPLSDAIRNVGKEIMTGKSLQDGLMTITKTIKSDVLETTVKLIIKGTRAGGQLVTLFEETAADIRRLESVRKDVKANIMMYGIFIGFAACLGAPVLYSLSMFLVNTIGGLGATVTVPQEFSGRLSLMKFGVTISPEFLFLFSITSLLITTIFGGLIIGLIGTGKEKEGIKYIPVLTIIALSVFFITGFFIEVMFGGILPT